MWAVILSYCFTASDGACKGVSHPVYPMQGEQAAAGMGQTRYYQHMKAGSRTFEVQELGAGARVAEAPAAQVQAV